MNPSITLIGSGWLGGPLFNRLTSRYSNVIATSRHTSTSSIELDLKTKPIAPEAILKSDIIVYTIPPLELECITHFFDQFSPDKKILFTTSTSVYSRVMGEVDEKTQLDPKDSNSPLLVETEKYLMKKFKNCTIVRPGGLYGLHRHPVFFLAGKNNLNNGNEYLHLASLNDCLEGISLIIEKKCWGEIFNFVSDLRIRKKEYYPAMAKKLALPDINYSEDESINDKSTLNVSNLKSKTLLGLRYEDPRNYEKSAPLRD